MVDGVPQLAPEHFAGRAGKARVRVAPPSHRLRSAARPHRNGRRGGRRCPACPRSSQSSSRVAWRPVCV